MLLRILLSCAVLMLLTLPAVQRAIELGIGYRFSFLLLF